MISFMPLWKTLLEKGMNKTELRDKIGISNGTLAKMGKNQFVSLMYVDSICRELNCKVDDVIEFVDDAV